MAVESLVSESYLGSTIPQYLLFFAAVAAGAVVGRSLTYVYERRLKATAEATETQIDDIILYTLGRPVILLGVVLGVAVGRGVLTPVEPLATVLNASVKVPVIVALAWLTIRLTDGLIETYMMGYAEATESRLDDQLVPILSRIANIAIAAIGGVVILDTLGYEVTAIIASLGIGGVAIAFASRKTMADIFGGAHILTTKPFVVDDIVEIGDDVGTVEEISLRTTRLRDFDGRLITVPNATIANVEVTNITSEPTRRITTSLGLSYDTSPSEMDEALALAQETVNAVDGVDPEKTGAWFWEYGERALQIRLEYHIQTLERWRDVKDTVNRDLQEAFADAPLELAVPTRTVHVENKPL